MSLLGGYLSMCFLPCGRWLVWPLLRPHHRCCVTVVPAVECSPSHVGSAALMMVGMRKANSTSVRLRADVIGECLCARMLYAARHACVYVGTCGHSH